MDKNELYDALKNDGAKLKLINFYTQEQLQEIYDERFGDFDNDLDGAVNTEDVEEYHEEPNTEKLNDEDYFHQDDPPTSPDDNDLDGDFNDLEQPAEVEIRTLMFDRGGWCDKLGKSYAPGIYRPATVEEFVILKEYAKEIL